MRAHGVRTHVDGQSMHGKCAYGVRTLVRGLHMKTPGLAMNSAVVMMVMLVVRARRPFLRLGDAA